MNADHHVTRNGLCRFHLIASRATQPLAGLPNLRWGRDTRVGRGGQPFAMGRNRFAVFTLCDMLLPLCVQLWETQQTSFVPFGKVPVWL
jgi:hypothetical protein